MRNEPLAQFQATKAEETEIRALIQDINRYVSDGGGRALPEKDVDEIFDLHWPRLKEKLEAISHQQVPTEPVRQDSEKLDEILEIVRDQERRMQQLESSQSGLFLFQPGTVVGSAGVTPFFSAGGPGGIPTKTAAGETVTFIPKLPRVSMRKLKYPEEPPIQKEEDEAIKSKE